MAQSDWACYEVLTMMKVLAVSLMMMTMEMVMTVMMVMMVMVMVMVAQGMNDWDDMVDVLPPADLTSAALVARSRNLDVIAEE